MFIKYIKYFQSHYALSIQGI